MDVWTPEDIPYPVYLPYNCEVCDSFRFLNPSARFLENCRMYYVCLTQALLNLGISSIFRTSGDPNLNPRCPFKTQNSKNSSKLFVWYGVEKVFSNFLRRSAIFCCVLQIAKYKQKYCNPFFSLYNRIPILHYSRHANPVKRLCRLQSWALT